VSLWRTTVSGRPRTHTRRSHRMARPAAPRAQILTGTGSVAAGRRFPVIRPAVVRGADLLRRPVRSASGDVRVRPRAFHLLPRHLHVYELRDWPWVRRGGVLRQVRRMAAVRRRRREGRAHQVHHQDRHGHRVRAAGRVCPVHVRRSAGNGQGPGELRVGNCRPIGRARRRPALTSGSAAAGGAHRLGRHGVPEGRLAGCLAWVGAGSVMNDHPPRRPDHPPRNPREGPCLF